MLGKQYYFHTQSAGPDPEWGKGRDLVTQNSNYVRVFIDQYERVAAITYLGSKPIEADNYQTLIGLHQAYLNRIVDRFDENLITDLIRYFNVL